jgi:hypothetical protein
VESFNELRQARFWKALLLLAAGGSGVIIVIQLMLR